MLSLVRWLVRTEVGIWRSLVLLVTRRVAGKRPADQAFPYAREIAPIIGAFIFVSLIELPVVHLLIPWDSVRLVVFIVSVWGLLWMVGLLASMKVFPHLLGDDELRIRCGAQVEIRIPREAVASVGARRDRVPTRESVVVEDGVLSVPVLKQTRIELTLHGPTAIDLGDRTVPVTAVRLYVDKPRDFVTATLAAIQHV